jgi:hypothetical protein
MIVNLPRIHRAGGPTGTGRGAGAPFLARTLGEKGCPELAEEWEFLEGASIPNMRSRIASQMLSGNNLGSVASNLAWLPTR